MTRQTLPERREAHVVGFVHHERRWTASFGYFADGRLGEVFLDAPKADALSDMARELALVASLALQAGCELAVLRHALAGRDEGPLAAALALADGGA